MQNMFWHLEPHLHEAFNLDPNLDCNPGNVTHLWRWVELSYNPELDSVNCWSGL